MKTILNGAKYKFYMRKMSTIGLYNDAGKHFLFKMLTYSYKKFNSMHMLLWLTYTET